MKNLIVQITMVLLGMFILGGCGGGGGGGEGTSVVVSGENFALRQAFINYITETSSSTFTISGTYAGNPVSGSGTLTNGNVSSGLFEGSQALLKTSTVTGTINLPGTTVPMAVTSTIFFDTNYDLLGKLIVGGEYSIATSIISLPISGKVGDTNIWYKFDNYLSNTSSVVSSTSTGSYAIEPDTASTAILKLIQTDSDGLVATTSFRMTTDGQLTRLSETGLDPSIPASLTISY